MENIIRIPSQQSSFNATNNLVDIIIPGNSGVYDLSEMYITIDTRLNVTTVAAAGDRGPQGAGYIEAEDAVQNVLMGISHGPASIYDKTACPVEILVRNCSLMSQSKGKVEDIRRSDRLRATMKSYLQDLDDVQSAALTGFTSGAAKTTPFAFGVNAELFGEGTVLSKRETHEIRIYLRDLFEIAKTDAWDSAVYGNTHIHLELNLSDIFLRQDLGDTVDAVQGGQAWTKIYHNPYVAAPLAAGEPKVIYSKSDPVVYDVGGGAGPNLPANSVQTTVTMSAVYQSLEDSPFWVGQILTLTALVSATSQGGSGATTVPAIAAKKWAVVKGITYDPITKKITLDFGATISTVTAVTNGGAAGYQQEMVVTGWDADIDASTIEYDTIELTAIRRTDMDSGPKQIQYNQWMVQSDQWSSATTLNRSYFLPPRTSTAVIVLPCLDTNGSKFLGSQRLSSYRFTVNGESVTNRAINYMPQAALAPATSNAKAEAGSALHYDMISNSMMNMGVRYSSLQECVYDQSMTDVNTPPTENGGLIGYANLGVCPRKRSYMLALPIPESDGQTQLTIELEGHFVAGTGALELYSYVTSAI
tara:strand:- start:1738 stop:3501 length:1764 start_codon:yes stop_codon:yes gene_type:complete